MLIYLKQPVEKNVIPFTCISVDTQFRMSILERLEQMEQRMAEITNQNPSSEAMATKGGGVEGGGATDQQTQVRQWFCFGEFSHYRYVKVYETNNTVKQINQKKKLIKESLENWVWFIETEVDDFPFLHNLKPIFKPLNHLYRNIVKQQLV